MNTLTVSESNGVLVVDSRLIAQELGIRHKSFMETIRKHEKETEQAFGILRFETAEIIGKGQPEKYAYLTEEESTFIMTLSRNTERVVQCKIQLVKAFTEARKLLEKVRSTQTNQESNRPALSSAREKLENIQLGMELMAELGGCDKKTQVEIKEQVRNILLAEKLQASSKINKYPVAMYSIGRSNKV